VRVDDHDQRLAEALKEAGYPESVIDRAKMGEWSDFKTELAAPKMDLVAMLVRDGHDDLAERVKTGEFDG
jgi:hypothetical protein